MQLPIKRKLFVFFVLVMAGVALLVNSCKKDNSDTVSYFLTNGSWQLASVTRQNFIGGDLKTTDVLNVNCSANLQQAFTFTANSQCNFANFHCIAQKSAGTWRLSDDNLTLFTSLTAQDTAKGGVLLPKPVAIIDTAKLVTLGQYSLVFQTGNISTYYTSTTPRVIITYGFIHGN